MGLFTKKMPKEVVEKEPLKGKVKQVAKKEVVKEAVTKVAPLPENSPLHTYHKILTAEGLRRRAVAAAQVQALAISKSKKTKA